MDDQKIHMHVQEKIHLKLIMVHSLLEEGQWLRQEDEETDGFFLIQE
jgi:hypothetical protein